jgi:hypothetical protein
VRAGAVDGVVVSTDLALVEAGLGSACARAGVQRRKLESRGMSAASGFAAAAPPTITAVIRPVSCRTTKYAPSLATRCSADVSPAILAAALNPGGAGARRTTVGSRCGSQNTSTRSAPFAGSIAKS